MAQKASLSFSTLPAPMGDPQSWVTWNSDFFFDKQIHRERGDDDGSDETGRGFLGAGGLEIFLGRFVVNCFLGEVTL